MVEIRSTPVSHSALVASAIAAHLMFSTASEQPPAWPKEQPRLKLAGALGSFSSTTWVHHSNPDQQLVTFYSDLLSNQQRLGPAFEKVLLENLWDLYER